MGEFAVKRIAVLGSTGSIGTQTLDVCRRLGYEIVALAAGSNAELLEKQAREFSPKLVAAADENAETPLIISTFLCFFKIALTVSSSAAEPSTA